MTVALWDKDTQDDDYLGEVDIDLNPVFTNNTFSDWYTIKDQDQSNGRIQIEFEFIGDKPKNDGFQMNPFLFLVIGLIVIILLVIFLGCFCFRKKIICNKKKDRPTAGGVNVGLTIAITQNGQTNRNEVPTTVFTQTGQTNRNEVKKNENRYSGLGSTFTNVSTNVSNLISNTILIDQDSYKLEIIDFREPTEVQNSDSEYIPEEQSITRVKEEVNVTEHMPNTKLEEVVEGDDVSSSGGNSESKDEDRRQYYQNNGLIVNVNHYYNVNPNQRQNRSEPTEEGESSDDGIFLFTNQ